MESERPDFVLNPPLQEEELLGIGGAKGPSIPNSLRLAETRARQSLANQLQSLVQTIITNYIPPSGTQNRKVEFAQNIQNKLVETNLYEIEIVKRAGTSNGTCWVMVRYKKDKAAKMVADLITREAAQYPEFKDMDALTLMNQQLERINTKPVVVTQ
jgi:hypothetical protein